MWHSIESHRMPSRSPNALRLIATPVGCSCRGGAALAQDQITLETVVVDRKGGSGKAGSSGQGVLKAEGYVAKDARVGTRIDADLRKVPQAIAAVSRTELEDRNTHLTPLGEASDIKAGGARGFLRPTNPVAGRAFITDVQAGDPHYLDQSRSRSRIGYEFGHRFNENVGCARIRATSRSAPIGLGSRPISQTYASNHDAYENDARVLIDAAVGYDPSAVNLRLAGVKAQFNAKNAFDDRKVPCDNGYCYREEDRSLLESLRYRF